jgi:hypothetical protein
MRAPRVVLGAGRGGELVWAHVGNAGLQQHRAGALGQVPGGSEGGGRIVVDKDSAEHCGDLPGFGDVHDLAPSGTPRWPAPVSRSGW